MTVELRDHSLNLGGDPGERDLGFGIDRLADGSIVQREEPADFDTDTDQPED
jgi:hypothetical protein